MRRDAGGDGIDRGLLEASRARLKGHFRDVAASRDSAVATGPGGPGHGASSVLAAKVARPFGVRGSSRKSVWTCSSSQMRNTWPVGRSCVQVIGRVPGNDRAGGRAREALGYGGICANRPGGIHPKEQLPVGPVPSSGRPARRQAGHPGGGAHAVRNRLLHPLSACRVSPFESRLL